MSEPWQRREVIGDCTLYLGDCLGILPTLGNVDAVVTDPPYGINYVSGYGTAALWGNVQAIRGDDNTAVRDAALAWLRGVPGLVFGTRRAPLPDGTRMVLVWDKGPALGMGALDIPWKPSAEEIYVIGRGFIGARDEGSVIACSPVQSMAKNGRLHQNEKPVSLLLRLLAKCPPGTVIDPFMGSGTTGVACVNLGRKFVGIEIEPRYFDIACQRIEAAVAAPRLPLPEPPAKQEALL